MHGNDWACSSVSMSMLQPCYESVAPKYTGKLCSSSTVAVMNCLLCVQRHLAHQWHCDQGTWGHPVAGRWDIRQRLQLLAECYHCQRQEWWWQCHLLLLWWVSHLLCLLRLLLMMMMIDGDDFFYHVCSIFIVWWAEVDRNTQKLYKTNVQMGG